MVAEIISVDGDHDEVVVGIGGYKLTVKKVENQFEVIPEFGQPTEAVKIMACRAAANALTEKRMRRKVERIRKKRPEQLILF